MVLAVELGLLLSLAAGQGTLLARLEPFQAQESELESLAQVVVMRSSLIQPAELGVWLSLEIEPEASLSQRAVLRTLLLALVAGLWALQVQAVGIQVSQDLVAELVFGLDSSGKAFLCQGVGLVVLFFLLAGKMPTWESYLAVSPLSVVLAVLERTSVMAAVREVLRSPQISLGPSEQLFVSL